jgi:hypothetical protein
MNSTTTHADHGSDDNNAVLLEGELTRDIIGCFYRVLEIKASEVLPPTGRKQLLNYLRGSTLEVGLLFHFGPKAAFQRLIFTNANKSRGFSAA